DPGDGSRRTVRHHAMPDFVTSGEIVPASSGNSFRAEFLQQTEAPYLTPGADIDRSQMHEFTYYIMEDGRELMRYRPAGCSSQRGCR
ncbi:MAG: hypothetical protein KDK27_20430, partial [Leptospiraceae bacterium]|nr:hypothetical protein [Leptospiraceae bacterium]